MLDTWASLVVKRRQVYFASNVGCTSCVWREYVYVRYVVLENSLQATWANLVLRSCSTDVASTVPCLNMWDQRSHSLLLAFTLLGSQCQLYICCSWRRLARVLSQWTLILPPFLGVKCEVCVCVCFCVKCVREFHGHGLLLFHKPWPAHSTQYKWVLYVRVCGLDMFCEVTLHSHQPESQIWPLCRYVVIFRF